MQQATEMNTIKANPLKESQVNPWEHDSHEGSTQATLHKVNHSLWREVVSDIKSTESDPFPTQKLS